MTRYFELSSGRIVVDSNLQIVYEAITGTAFPLSCESELLLEMIQLKGIKQEIMNPSVDYFLSKKREDLAILFHMDATNCSYDEASTYVSQIYLKSLDSMIKSTDEISKINLSDFFDKDEVKEEQPIVSDVEKDIPFIDLSKTESNLKENFNGYDLEDDAFDDYDIVEDFDKITTTDKTAVENLEEKIDVDVLSSIISTKVVDAQPPYHNPDFDELDNDDLVVEKIDSFDAIADNLSNESDEDVKSSTDPTPEMIARRERERELKRKERAIAKEKRKKKLASQQALLDSTMVDGDSEIMPEDSPSTSVILDDNAISAVDVFFGEEK